MMPMPSRHMPPKNTVTSSCDTHPGGVWIPTAQRAMKIAARSRLSAAAAAPRREITFRGRVVPWMMLLMTRRTDSRNVIVDAPCSRSECWTSTLCTWFDSCRTIGLSTGVRVSWSTSASASGRRMSRNDVCRNPSGVP